ncbi:MAG: hypothetical protein U9P42_06080 [Candidatus Fermentibacteria bacterium]|nr:hypothetical protein [Candidatus Fermentibacteria bacterium]
MSTADKDTLHILSIFHYILAGIIALIFCIPLVHLAMGLTMTVGGVTENVPVLGIVGAALSVVIGLIILVGWGLAVLVFLAGKNLDSQTRYQVCLFGAGVLCVFLPLGTVLGVFTLVTLQSDSVKELFSRNESRIQSELPDDLEPSA